MEKTTRIQLIAEINRFKGIVDGLRQDDEVSEKEHSEINRNINHIRGLLYGTGYKNQYWVSKPRTQVWKPGQ